jgi:L-lactate dehydrogenase (cytochrome)
MLPAIMAAAGKRATVMIDSGIRSGLDVLRALALGASAAFIGRPFLYGLGALGEPGARFVMDMFADELRTEMKHVGIQAITNAREIAVRHPGAWRAT